MIRKKHYCLYGGDGGKQPFNVTGLLGCHLGKIFREKWSQLHHKEKIIIM